MKSWTSKIILLSFVCLFVCNNIFANEVDSLKKLIATKGDDTTKVNLLNTLSKKLLDDNPDTAMIIASTAIKLAEGLHYHKGLALAYKNTGLGYYKQGKYIDAVKTWEQALSAYKQAGDKKGVANMLSNEGAVYFNQGDDAKSLELHLQSLKISEEINDTLRIVTSLTNIGGIYLNKEATYNKALEYFLRSYQLGMAINDAYSIGTAATNLGETYFKLKKDSIALIYLDKSVTVYKADNSTDNLPYPLNYLGRVYTRQHEFEKAVNTHMEAYTISKEKDLPLDLTQSLVGLGEAYEAKGDIDDAIGAYKNAVEVGIKLNSMTELKDAYEGLSKVYEKKSDYANAYQFQKRLMSIKDSIFSDNTRRKLGMLQFNFDMDKKESQISLLNKDREIQERELQRQKLVRNGFIGGFAIVLLFATVFFAQRNKISKEKKRSEELLLNILPEETAEELKSTGTAKTKSFDLVSVLFTDFKNFTYASERLTPEELVAEINHCYSEFDRIISKHNIEKIKTIGDSYMCAGGLPVVNTTHPFDIVSAGLEMVAFIERNKMERQERGQPYFELRLGIHTGPLVAGIVGIKKFAYDIWGDTVNTASRMESSGEVGRVNISGSTYELIKDKFICNHRGKIQAKNKGEIDMYFVDGIRG